MTFLQSQFLRIGGVGRHGFIWAPSRSKRRIEETAASNLHIATKDGEAMFFHETLNFSEYAGTDAGSTPYWFEFVDSAGKKATAFGGNVGGGEALDSELVLNGNMETGDPPTGWNINAGSTLSRVADERTGGSGSYSLEAARGALGNNVCSSVNLSAGISIGSIVKTGFWGKTLTANWLNYLIRTSGGEADTYLTDDNLTVGITTSSWSNRSTYGTFKIGTASAVVYLFVDGAAGVTARFDDISMRKLTDVPATGLHLMSSRNGTTRNMEAVESGFDPNDIQTINIWSL